MKRFLVLTSLLAIALSSIGCGGSSTAAIQDNVDYSKAMDLFSAPFGQPSGTPHIDPQSVIARVDGKPISRAMFTQGVELQMMNLKQRMSPEDLEQVRPRVEQEVLQQIILQILLMDAVQDEQIKVPAEKIDARIAEMKQGIPTDVTWEESLSRSHMTEEKLRNQITSQMQMDRLLQSRMTDIPSPTEADVRAFYEKNKAQFKKPESAVVRHLLIKVPPGGDEAAHAEALKKATSLHEFIRKGSSLEELASHYTEDETTKEKGGLLGSVVRGQLPPALDAVVFDADVGTVSEPVQSPAGYHLMAAESRLPAEQAPYEEAREWIQRHLLDTARQNAIRDYMTELKEHADIQIAGVKRGDRPTAP